MKRVLIFILFLYANSSIASVYILTENTVVVLAEKEKGIELISKPDFYTQNFGAFDLASKVNTVENPTIEDYLDFAAEQVREWTVAEKEKLANTISYTSDQIKKLSLKLNLPDTVYVIKTTGKEEGGAGGYTRSDYIVLNGSTINVSQQRITSLFIHELFHVLSRSDPGVREKLYNVIGFEKCNNIELPDDIFNLKISNPDAPFFDYYARLKTNDGKEFDGIMVIYSEKDYAGGSFFSYMKMGFIKITGDEFNKTAVTENNKTVIIPLTEVKNFFELVGSNTQYIINPEEIAADNFVYTITEKKDLSNPEIIDKFLLILQN